MASNPFRACDYCGSTRNSPPREPRLARRAWSLFPTTRKVACPSCCWKGRQEDARLRLVIADHYGLLRNRLVAEPEEPYGDALQRQWRRIKEKHPEPVLLFRAGDCYHAFGDDARVLYQRCGMQLEMTRRLADPFAVSARFPVAALDDVLPMLVRAGHRVAVCDQLQGPPVPGMVCEPLAPYRKPPTRAERYLKNDQRMVLERLLDLEVVLLRHKALPAYTTGMNRWERANEDDRARDALLKAKEAVALELRLRNAELVHDSIRCRIGNAECLFRADTLPMLIREYRRNTRNAA